MQIMFPIHRTHQILCDTAVNVSKSEGDNSIVVFLVISGARITLLHHSFFRKNAVQNRPMSCGLWTWYSTYG